MDGQRRRTASSTVDPRELQYLPSDFRDCVIVIVLVHNMAINLGTKAEMGEELAQGSIHELQGLVAFCPTTRPHSRCRRVAACAMTEGRARGNSVLLSELHVLWYDAPPQEPCQFMTRLWMAGQLGSEVKPLARPKRPPDI